jgi:hypothetical protein
MADIFISYSQVDRDLAEALAAFLTESGYEVWWDSKLVGGETFRRQILMQLEMAKGAVVIWTPSSVKSDFVIDESEQAQRDRKLVATRVESLNISEIPLGFRGLHTIPVRPFDGILSALAKLGVQPSRPPKVPESPPNLADITVAGLDAADMIALQHWEFVKESANPAAFRKFIEEFSGSKLAPLAKMQLAKMAAEAWQKRSDEISSLEQYVAQFPDDAHAEEATHRIEVLRARTEEAASWARIKDGSDIKAVEEHISLYPGGANAKAALQKLEALKRERDARKHWLAIAGATEPRPFEEYIELYSDTTYAAQARARLESILREREEADWNAIRDERHPLPFLRFLKAHPNGHHAADALSAAATLPEVIEREAWAEVRNSDLPIALTAYIAAVPNSRNVRAARARLRALGKVQTQLSAIDPLRPRPKRWKRFLFWFCALLMVAAATGFTALVINSPYSPGGLQPGLIGSAISLGLTVALLRLLGPRLYPPPADRPHSRAVLFSAVGALGIFLWMISIESANYMLYGRGTILSPTNIALALVVFLLGIIGSRSTRRSWLRYVYYGLLVVIGIVYVETYQTYRYGSLILTVPFVGGGLLLLLSGLAFLLGLLSFANGISKPLSPKPR